MERVKQFIVFILLTQTLVAVRAQNGFKEIAEQAGINHYFEVYEGMFGGGACVLDFDNDGFEDLYLTGGRQPDQLLHNQGNGSFKNVFEKSGLEITGEFATQGVAAADVNRDGLTDLFISTLTEIDPDRIIPRARNLLFLNKGNGKFEEVGQAYGIAHAESFSTGVAFGDVNADGYPDIYVGNYFTDYEGGLKEISDATIVNAGKTAKGYLYINKKGKRFVNSYKAYGLEHRGFSFGGVFTDFDNDHDMDIIVNNDFGYKAKPNYLLENQYPKKKFKYVEKDKEMDLRINAMGAAVGDYDEDGWLDYFITNIRFNWLMKNQGAVRPFIDEAKVMGLNLFTISWGANFADFDHDGDLDLFVANGDLNPNCVPMHNFYFENELGKFNEKSNEFGLRDYGLGRGSVVFDLENDGDLDLLLINQEAVMEYGAPSTTRLYRNDHANGNYIKIALRGKYATHEGLGARVDLYTGGKKIIQEVDGGNSSHLSHNSRNVHFGLGNTSYIDSVKVIWPGGKTQKIGRLDVNQSVVIHETENEKKYSFLIIFVIGILILITIVIFIKNKY
ncbi:CRTAC1 family protein [Flavobacteriaceae bacterium]|nr:CRTAC1 family protein [Flavobacteriaceae bacterium]